MPSAFTHAAVPLMLGAAAGRRRVSGRLLAAGAVAAMLPDADVLAFALHIPYASDFGHRGATHSMVFALLLAALAALWHRQLDGPPLQCAAFVGLAALSHPLLDACTDGGLGVALWWPFSDARWFAPFHPIAVSPIGARFFSERGLHVMLSELCWVWLPTALLAVCLWAWRWTSRRM
ncbi:MAG TPA: metal-dependent hydrolase [Dyella sp.]|uniref:metal-dependent hydrolase n=1 Tax=Dyella sp. TaxID=1869338 RepID=UPI002D78DD68|nr:metal-dependent hydrolase [Dyella sp.]HET6552729.1 metal-dependent hydrolase [Dyella sp.]